MCTVGNSKTLKQPKHPVGGDGYINDMTYRRQNTTQPLKRTGYILLLQKFTVANHQTFFVEFTDYSTA